jgi:hypothetical protein
VYKDLGKWVVAMTNDPGRCGLRWNPLHHHPLGGQLFFIPLPLQCYFDSEYIMNLTQFIYYVRSTCMQMESEKRQIINSFSSCPTLSQIHPEVARENYHECSDPSHASHYPPLSSINHSEIECLA